MRTCEVRTYEVEVMVEYGFFAREKDWVVYPELGWTVPSDDFIFMSLRKANQAKKDVVAAPWKRVFNVSDRLPYTGPEQVIKSRVVMISRQVLK